MPSNMGNPIDPHIGEGGVYPAPYQQQFPSGETSQPQQSIGDADALASAYRQQGQLPAKVTAAMGTQDAQDIAKRAADRHIPVGPRNGQATMSYDGIPFSAEQGKTYWGLRAAQEDKDLRPWGAGVQLLVGAGMILVGTGIVSVILYALYAFT